MPGQKPPSGTKGGKKEKKLRSLAARAKDETDPLWRNWYLEIDNRRKALNDRKKKPLVVSEFRKDDKDFVVARKQATPSPLKEFLKQNRKKVGSKTTQDLLWIREAWATSVGPDIAGETEVYAFKAGVLTISVFSGVLLQEIRQFHAESILADLRDIWQASIPLIKIIYRPGKR